MVFNLLSLPGIRGSFKGRRRPRFHGFSIDNVLILPHILYPCYKTKFLNIHRAGYEYFKDSFVVFYICFTLIWGSFA